MTLYLLLGDYVFPRMAEIGIYFQKNDDYVLTSIYFQKNDDYVFPRMVEISIYFQKNDEFTRIMCFLLVVVF